MKQILQSYRSGELWLADVPTPALRDGGVLVRTAASVVSAGTERMIVQLAQQSLLAKARARPDLVRKVIRSIRTEGISEGLSKAFARLDAPIAMGYACAGTVVESAVPGVRPGDRVACAGAGYATHAEANAIPRNLIAKIPPNVTFEQAGFTTLGAIAMQAVRQSDVRIGETVAVIGLGLIGLLAVQILKAAGCRVIGCDLDVARCELATSLGADDATSDGLAGVVASHTSDHGADAVILTAASSSNEPLELAAEISRTRGRIVVVGMVGMQVPRDVFYRKELDLRLSTSYGPGRYDRNYEESGHDYPYAYVRWTEQRNMSSFLDLLNAGRISVDKLITHRFDIDDALQAYALMQQPDARPLGIVIRYPDREPDPIDAPTIELRRVEPSDRIGVGLIGAGAFARGVLLPKMKRIDGIELVSLCTSSAAGAAHAAKKHGFAHATTDAEGLITDPRITAVVIATRHDSHARLACAALRAGKHVYVEKPLCIAPGELEEYERAVEASPNRCLIVGFNRRFSPHTLAALEVYESRKSPMVISYRINAGRIPRDSWLHDPRVGGGRIVGEMCHFIDWCECVTGSIPIAVHADCAGGDSSSAGDDSVVATLRYADGSLASIQYISLGSGALPKERIEVYADGIVAVVDDFTSTSFHGVRRRALRTRQDKGHAALLDAFFRAVRSGGEPPIRFPSMARTMRVSFAIVESLRHGREVPLEASVDPA